MSETKTPIGRLWTLEEREVLRRMLSTGSTVRQVADALGRPFSSVQTAASKAGLTSWDRILRPTREGIRDFAAQGWSSRRIAQRFKVPIEFVDHLTGRTTP